MTLSKPPHYRSPRTRCALQYTGTQEGTPMWEEIQDMPGEIFDVPNIETILVEDENGDIGVDLTEDA